MEEEFYSTIKLTSGEEIIAKVCFLTEENSLLIEKPLLVEKVTQRKLGRSITGFILKEWINSTYDEMFVIKMEQVITMTELDDDIEKFYINVLSQHENDSVDIRPNNFSRRMGYLGSVNETKKYLEDIFKRS